MELWHVNINLINCDALTCESRGVYFLLAFCSQIRNAIHPCLSDLKCSCFNSIGRKLLVQQNILGFECFLAGKCRKIADFKRFFDEKIGGLFFLGLVCTSVYHNY